MPLTPIPTPNPPAEPSAVPAQCSEWVCAAWDWVNDYGAAIGAVATVLAVIVAIASLAAAAKDNRARSRPMVIAEFRRARRNDRAIDLVVRNVGPSLATHLKVEFEPPISAVEAPTTTAHLIALRYALPNLILGPNQELKNLWWSSRPGPNGTVINSEPTPATVKVDVSYKGTRWRRYRDTFEMNINSIKYETESISSATPERQLKAGVQQLGKIVTGLTAIRNALQNDDEVTPDFVDAMVAMGVLDPPLTPEDADPDDGAGPRPDAQEERDVETATGAEAERESPTEQALAVEAEAEPTVPIVESTPGEPRPATDFGSRPEPGRS